MINFVIIVKNICLNLKCNNNYFVVSARDGALEGTSCGLNRRCEQDKCRRIPLDEFDLYVDEQMAVAKKNFGAVYSNITFI